jgi:uncharacterized protein YbjQ (UPF0145 family)
MLITTTSTVQNKEITEYLGLVSGTAIIGVNAFKDFFASIRDLVGGRSAAYEEEMNKAKSIAMEEIQQMAVQMGANGIVGIDIDFETLGQSNGMLMVSISGTAVIIK